MLDKINNLNIQSNNPIKDNNFNKSTTKIEQVLPYGVVDPTKVTKVAKQDPNNQAGQNQYGYNPDSVFEKFVQSLQNYPILAEGAKKLLLNRQFINSNIKNDPILKSLFESFLESIEMDEVEIKNFLKYQQGNYTKFHGEFFDNLRTLLKSYPNNEDFKIVVRNFLKNYDCFVSIENTNKSINAALLNIERNLPEMLKASFKEMTDKLIMNTNSIDINLSVLKNEILPFMGRYISKMNDFGPVRDYVSVLIHNIIRLESASKDNFTDSLENLFEHIKYNFDIDENYLESLKMSLINTYETSLDNNNKVIDSFLKLIETGMKESENLVSKGVMEDMTESLLYSQNVHIPLTHLFLPLNYNGMFMFSELWIGKEYEKNTDKKRKQEIVEAYKMFVTFDIQNIGYFEAILVMKGEKLGLDIYVPSSLSNYSNKIKDDLSKIISRNNVNVAEIRVQESTRKKRFSEVFSNLTERKSGVDVTI